MNIHKICPNPSLNKFNTRRLWHDNSGTSPSWFVNYIVVRDLQRDEKFYFVCQRWLAADKEDGKVCFIYYCNIKNCAYRDSNSELSLSAVSSKVLCRISGGRQLCLTAISPNAVSPNAVSPNDFSPNAISPNTITTNN